MKNDEVKHQYDELSRQLKVVIKSLKSLEPHLTLNMDKRANNEIQNDLIWSVEKISVIGLHQINEALEDNNGTGLKD
jgi:hypothetical protein